MSKIKVTTTVNNKNHVRNDYQYDDIFLNFPNQQKAKTFVNGTASERTILAGTLVGLTTADQTIAKTLQSDAVDGSQIPYGFLLYDTVIAAGAAEEVEALVGFGDDKSSIFADQITLEKSGDTVDTNIVDLGITIRNAVMAYCKVQIEESAQNVSDFRNADV